MRYFVVGRGPFPTDMLRYDEAEVIDGDARDEWDLRLPIRVVEIEGKHCTEARWRSFLWGVFWNRESAELVLPPPRKSV